MVQHLTKIMNRKEFRVHYGQKLQKMITKPKIMNGLQQVLLILIVWQISISNMCPLEEIEHSNRQRYETQEILNLNQHITLLKLKIAQNEYSANLMVNKIFVNGYFTCSILFYLIFIFLSWRVVSKESYLQQLQGKITFMEEKYQKRKVEIYTNLSDFDNLKREKLQELESLGKSMQEMKAEYEDMCKGISRMKSLENEISQSPSFNTEKLKKEISVFSEMEKIEKETLMENEISHLSENTEKMEKIEKETLLENEISQTLSENPEKMEKIEKETLLEKPEIKKEETGKCEKWENLKNFDEKISADEMIDLCEQTRRIIELEPMLIRTTTPVSTIGDIHGNLVDLKMVLSKNGNPLDCGLLFLGDYVDRGLESVAVLVCLFRLKIEYPEHVTLLRGNHEDSSQNAMEFSPKHLLGDCKIKFPADRFREVYEAINNVFEALPLAALIDDKIFCCHGGIGPGMEDISDIFSFPRIRSLSSDNSSSAHFNLLWADPKEIVGFGRSPRTHDENCSVRTWGKNITEEFLARNSLTLVVRAHELCQNGMAMRHQGKVITIFSSSYYCGQNNIGAFLRWNSAEFAKAKLVKLRNITNVE